MEFYTRDEVAKNLRVHNRTIDRWIKSGFIIGYKFGKGRTSPWRISKEDFERFLKKNRSKK